MTVDPNHLSTLIDEEANSGRIRLDEKRLQSIKQICKTSDNHVREAFRLLRQYLDEDHAEIRWSCFLLIKELFSRSHCFRELLIEDINEYLVLVAEIDPTKPLPLPKTAAGRLKEASISAFKAWNDKYGGNYKKLNIAFRFLEETRKIKVPATQDPVQLFGVPDAVRPTRRDVDQRKIDTVKSKITENQTELDILIKEIESLFQIVVPDFREETCGSSSESSDLRAHGLPSFSYNIEVSLKPASLCIKKTTENEAIVEKIEECALLLNGKFLPLSVHWLSVLSKYGADHDDLKYCIDLKQKLCDLLRKAATLGIQFLKPAKRKTVMDDDSDHDDDDGFEEVPEKEGLELIIPPNKRKEYGLEMISQNVQQISAPKVPHISNYQEKRTQVSESSKRDLHLAIAPIVSFGCDLEHWGKEMDKLPVMPMSQQFDALHRFWTPHDTEKDSPNQDIANSLLTRSIPFTGNFEPVKWFCRAPLPNGQLCSRQDRLKCPFHGKIIARDVTGVPVDVEERRQEEQAKLKAQAEKVPDWQDPEFLRDLEAATGKNFKVEKAKRKKKKSNLTDVEKTADTPRQRLAKKVLNPSTVKRVSEQMLEIQRKTAAEKFAHNWNYTSEF